MQACVYNHGLHGSFSCSCDSVGSKNKVRRPVTKPSNPSHSKPKIKVAHPVLSLRFVLKEEPSSNTSNYCLPA